MEEDAWDFGVTGSVPAIIGGAQGISTVGIGNDESATNVLVGAPGVSEFPSDDAIYAATPSSTGELVLRECLAANDVDFSEDDITFASQGDIISLLADGSATYGALWAPNAYTYRGDNADAKTFCSGEDVGVRVLGNLVVRDEWASANTDTAARVLAAYLRGVSVMTNWSLRKESLEIAAEFYEYAEVEGLTAADIENDFLSRPVFNLDLQLSLMSRDSSNDETSSVDHALTDLADFMVSQGVIENTPEPSSYIDSTYAEYVSNDCYLRAFAAMGAACAV